MGIFSSGVMPAAGSGNRFLKLDDKGINTLYVLPETPNKILIAPKYGVFVMSGSPINASWVSIGPQDVGNELGLKSQPKAFVWVWVPKNPKNLSEGGEARIWECSRTHFETIMTQVNEFGHDLRGLMLVLQKVNGRWQLSANKAPASKTVPAATLAEAWDELVADGIDGKSDEESFGKLVGVIPSPDLQRKFLIDRSQGKFKTWNDVRVGFGLSALDEDEGVEAY